MPPPLTLVLLNCAVARAPAPVQLGEFRTKHNLKLAGELLHEGGLGAARPKLTGVGVWFIAVQSFKVRRQDTLRQGGVLEKLDRSQALSRPKVGRRDATDLRCTYTGVDWDASLVNHLIGWEWLPWWTDNQQHQHWGHPWVGGATTVCGLKNEGLAWRYRAGTARGKSRIRKVEQIIV